MSVKQGLKYNSPESAADILPFIAFHALNIDEIQDPLDSFKTFNEFFYRKIKPSARPVAEPDNEGRVVSCADCRMMAFDTVNSATSIWIKGRDFSVAKLLGPNYKDVADRYEGGALGIFRQVTIYILTGSQYRGRRLTRFLADWRRRITTVSTRPSLVLWVK